MKLLAILLSVIVAACSDSGAKQQEKKGAKDAAPAAVPVAVLQAARRDVPVSFEAVGRTEGSREVQVRARVAGILEKQLYNEGERVKEGAPLFRIERAPFEIELQQARARSIDVCRPLGFMPAVVAVLSFCRWDDHNQGNYREDQGSHRALH